MRFGCLKLVTMLRPLAHSSSQYDASALVRAGKHAPPGVVPHHHRHASHALVVTAPQPKAAVLHQASLGAAHVCEHASTERLSERWVEPAVQDRVDGRVCVRQEVGYE